MSKVIQSGGSFDSWLGNLRKKALTNISILSARDNLPGLVSNLASYVKKLLGEQEKDLVYLFEIKI